MYVRMTILSSFLQKFSFHFISLLSQFPTLQYFIVKKKMSDDLDIFEDAVEDFDDDELSRLVELPTQEVQQSIGDEERR